MQAPLAPPRSLNAAADASSANAWSPSVSTPDANTVWRPILRVGSDASQGPSSHRPAAAVRPSSGAAVVATGSADDSSGAAVVAAGSADDSSGAAVVAAGSDDSAAVDSSAVAVASADSSSSPPHAAAVSASAHATAVARMKRFLTML